MSDASRRRASMQLRAIPPHPQGRHRSKGRPARRATSANVDVSPNVQYVPRRCPPKQRPSARLAPRTIRTPMQSNRPQGRTSNKPSPIMGTAVSIAPVSCPPLQRRLARPPPFHCAPKSRTRFGGARRRLAAHAAPFFPPPPRAPRRTCPPCFSVCSRCACGCAIMVRAAGSASGFCFCQH